MEEEKVIPHLSRFTRQVRLEWIDRNTSLRGTNHAYRAYRAWVGNHLVRRYISYMPPFDHVEVLASLWQDALRYVYTQGKLAERLDVREILAFFKLPVDPQRLHNMNEVTNERTNGGDGPRTYH